MTTTSSTAPSTGSLSAADLDSPAQRERHARILDATVTLAREGGFDAVQMRAVAERADVALGTLYRYFPSKVHLLVSALAREFERADAGFRGLGAIPGATPADRVGWVMRRTTRGLHDDPRLIEALTRAFVSADASVAAEIRVVETLLAGILTRAMQPRSPRSPADDDAIARVIGDVWLAALVAWVTGRSSAAETAAHLETAVQLLLRE
ncbi:cholesterol catabolism transcriptional regulator KstR [Nocardioides marinquilinus]|uniref:Cholesterol catabolism transcriptional regulator KstR n=1 Tax=Nocardioides marinquilinus TaxID=1210400 RepID=A0ABP9Q6I7_9ACTN